MKKKALLGLCLLVSLGAGCADLSKALGVGDEDKGSLVVKALSPICTEQIVKVENINDILETAKKVGVKDPEKKVCDCAIAKAEKQVTEKLEEVPELVTSVDKQIDFLIGLASECASEIAKSEFDNFLNDLTGKSGSSSAE